MNKNEKGNMEINSADHRDCTHCTLHITRSYELHVEKAVKKKRKAARKRRQKIKALKEAKASSKHKDAFSLFLGLFLYIESFKVVLVWAECPKAT